MRPVTCSYIPGPGFKGATSFLKNLQDNPIAGEHFFLSEHAGYGFGDENLLLYSPELHDAVRSKKTPTLSNLVFIMCLRKAALRKYTHMLYIESDCRFQGKGWDAIMFEDYCSLPFPAIAAGTVTAHSMINGGGQFYKRFDAYYKKNSGKNGQPMQVFGVPTTNLAREVLRDEFPEGAGPILPGNTRQKLLGVKPSLYPNGAIAIYDVAFLCEIFNLQPNGEWKPGCHLMEVVQWPAWDYVIGWALYDRFANDVFDVVGSLSTMYSSYGDIVDTEAERLQMLRDKKVFGVHQVKGEIAG